VNFIAHAFCPCCGTDIRCDQPIILNEFSMLGDGAPLLYKRKPIPMTPMQSALCWSLLKAFPAIVRNDVLLMRVGSEAESNAIDVQLSRIRAKLRARNIPNPIENVWGKGYRWSVDPAGVKVQGDGH
jgi:DNA-binding response OmpR family regulator